MKLFITVLVVVFALACPLIAQSQSPTTAAPVPALKVEATICTSVADHTPNGADSVFSAEVGSVCCWMRVIGAESETTLKHTWLHEGKTMAVVDLPVRGINWRTHSGKKILPAWTGRWEVKITDAAGNELKSLTFTVNAATGQ